MPVQIGKVNKTAVFNLYELCFLYIGQAYRYPPDVAFYTYIFQQI
jgi:hypothetical protein